MSVTIESFVPAPVPVTLPGGTVVQAVPVSMRDERLIERAHPRPAPPMKHEGGSLSPLKPDREDPVFVEQYGRWMLDDELLRVAVAIGFAPQIDGNDTSWAGAMGSAELEKRWCQAVLEQLAPAVSVAFVSAVVKRIETVDIGLMVDKAGPGNSGAPSTDR